MDSRDLVSCIPHNLSGSLKLLKMLSFTDRLRGIQIAESLVSKLEIWISMPCTWRILKTDIQQPVLCKNSIKCINYVEFDTSIFHLK